MPDPQRRKRTRLSSPERLEDRLAMTADAGFDFWTTQAGAPSGSSYNPFAAAGSSITHQQTGVSGVVADYGFTGARQTVVVIDTGIAWDHYALGRGFGEDFRVVGGWDFAENDADPYDDGPAGFHGTHVAGIIGGVDSRYGGVATGVDLVALRVFNDQGAGKFEWVEQALRWVHEHRASFENPITTVNLSLGAKWNAATLPSWATLEEELQVLHDDGIFISVAAGNDFANVKTAGLSYPAVSQYVVPVGSVTASGTFSSFSQRADRILAAPGQSITSAVPDWFYGGNGIANDFGAASGTSMAAPYVAGAAVLVREAMQFVGMTNITQETIYHHLRNTADSFSDAATNANYFRLNVGRAIDALMPADDYGGTNATAWQLGSLRDDLSLQGVIGKKSDVDRFSFTAAVSGTIVVDAAATGGLAANVKIVGATAQFASGKTSFRIVAGQSYVVEMSAKGGIGNYTLNLDVTADPQQPVPIDLGRIIQNQFSGQRISGEALYSLTAGQTGFLTLQTAVVAGSNLRVELLTADGRLLAQTTSARLDANVVAGESYLLRVVGNATDADFRLTNLVAQTGTSVQVNGTSGNDNFSFVAGASHVISINGMEYQFDARAVTSVSFDGHAGNDTVSLRGTTRTDTATFTPASAILAGESYRITAQEAEHFELHGGGGNDRFDLTGTSGDDVITIVRGDTWFRGGGLYLRSQNFSTVTANASTGSDLAKLLDSSGDDQFTADPNSASMTGPGYWHTVHGFDRVTAAASGGTDRATFNDSAGTDVFHSTGQTSWLTGEGFFRSATNFDHIAATSTQGADEAFFHELGQGDVLRGEGSSAALTRSRVLELIVGFDFVTAESNSRARVEVQAVDYLFTKQGRM